MTKEELRKKIEELVSFEEYKEHCPICGHDHVETAEGKEDFINKLVELLDN